VAGVTRIVTVANQKGGVGKTTTTVNIAAALAQAGHRILVVDLDPQGNASTALGLAHEAGEPSLYEVLTGVFPMADAIQECPDIPGLLGVPATIDLAGAEVELVGRDRREHALAEALERYLAECAEPPDMVLIDCPPSLGLLTLNGLVAAREVLLPIQCEYYALEGLSQLLKTVEMVRTHLNPDLAVGGILLTMYDGRTRLAAQVAEEVRRHFGATVLDTVIPRSVRLSEAPSYGQTVLTYDPTSPGALTYREAAEQLMMLHPQKNP
jgi:chromosome partitioning protein